MRKSNPTQGHAPVAAAAAAAAAYTSTAATASLHDSPAAPQLQSMCQAPLAQTISVSMSRG